MTSKTGLARQLARLGRVAYWTATLQLPRRYRDWQAARLGTNDPYRTWVRLHDTLTPDDEAIIRRDVERLERRPLFSVVMPTYNSTPDLLEEAIASVQSQLYPDWELCIADDASSDAGVLDLVRRMAASDPRIRWMRRERNGNISRSSNSAVDMARGEFLVLMDHDDLLPRHALYRVAKEIDADPALQALYSDEDQIDRAGVRHTPYFKPAWNVDLLLGQNVVSHLGVYRTDLVRAIGGFRVGFEGSQDHDLALRAVAAAPAGTVRHIPAILYHWRQIEGQSFSQRQLKRCVDASHRAVEDYLTTQLGSAPTPRVQANTHHGNWLRVHWPLPSPRPSVSIVIPTRDRADLLRTCLVSLRERTDYDGFEIVVVDNGSVEARTEALFADLEGEENVRILRMPGPFNYSRLNNEAVRLCRGEVVVLLNNDVEVMEPTWLTELISHAIRPDVGVVGAKLFFGDGTIQHAGVVLGAGLSEDAVAGHFGVTAEGSSLGYCGQYILTRELSAVTGACLAVRRSVYEEVGGLNESDLAVAFNDVDFCLRVRERGYRIVWTPFASLYHHESQTRGDDAVEEKAERFERERAYMARRWGDVLRNDPFYNPNFARGRSDFHLRDDDRVSKPWRYPPTAD